MPKIILIIEDDIDLSNQIAQALEKAGYACAQTFSASEALKLMEDSDFSLAVLDSDLPDGDGSGLLSSIRSAHSMPVVVISQSAQLDYKIRLLNAGADDYLTKPFEMLELVTRVSVQMRRRQSDSHADANILRYRDLILDNRNLSVRVNGKKVTLTRQEFLILQLMLQYPPGRVFSKQTFYESAWKDVYLGEDKTINVHISNIRKKLKAITDSEYIETVWGVGFRLVK